MKRDRHTRGGETKENVATSGKVPTDMAGANVFATGGESYAHGEARGNTHTKGDTPFRDTPNNYIKDTPPHENGKRSVPLAFEKSKLL